MGSAKKITLVSVSVLLLVVLAFVLILPRVLDLDKVRSAAEVEAANILGRQVTISRAGLSVWPSPVLTLEDISVADPPGLDVVPELRLSSLELGVAWTGILKGRIDITTVRVIKPGIVFTFDAGDPRNLTKTGELMAGAMLSVLRHLSDGASIKDTPVPVLLAPGNVRVQNGEVVFKDLSGKVLRKDLSIKGIEASLAHFSPAQPVEFEASLGAPGSGSKIAVRGTLGPAGGDPDPLNLPVNLSLKMVDFQFNKAPSPLTAVPLALSGTVRSEGSFTGSLGEGFKFAQIAEFEDIQLLTDEGFALVRDLAGSLDQKGTIDPGDRSIEVESFELTAGSARFSASGSVGHEGILPRVDMRFESNQIDLADFVKYFPDLEKRILMKGDLAITGHAKGTVAKDLLTTMDVTSSALEMDRGPLLLVRNQDPDNVSAGEHELTQLLPPSLPMTVAANISVPHGRFEWVEFSDLTAQIRIKDRWASLDTMDFSAFGGRLTGSSWFNMRKLPATYGNDIQVRDMEIDQFLSAFAGLKGVMYGRASLDLFVSGRGVNMDQFKETTLGLGRFHITSGKYMPANFFKGALEAASLSVDKSMPDQTEFDKMESTIAVRGGKIDFTELTCTAGDWLLDGSGIIGINQDLSLRYIMTLSDSAAKNIDKRDLQKLPRNVQGRPQIPFNLSGTFTSPEFSLDPDAMEKVAAN